MVKQIRAVTRSLEVLELVAESGRVSLADLHDRSGLPRATLLRILETLQANGWLYRSIGDGRYRLSAQLVLRTRPPKTEDRLVQSAAHILKDLQASVLWPSDIAVRDGLRMQILETSRPRAPITVNRSVMGYRPHMLWTAVGRAYIFNCPTPERQELLEVLRRSHEPRDPRLNFNSWAKEVLEATRQIGCGVRHEDYVPDSGVMVHAIAVPVMHHGDVACCINIVWPRTAFGVSQGIDRYLEPLSQAAHRLSGLLHNPDR